MSSAAAPPLSVVRGPTSTSAARVVVVVILGVTSLLGAALLAASLLPPATLASRLLGAAGEARSGAFTLELLVHFGERLRFAAACLLSFAMALGLARGPFEQLINAVLHHLTWPSLRPARAEVLALGAPTLLAVGLRSAFITQPMRYDEALTYNEFASRPLYYGLSFYPDPNNHLLNTLLMHLSAGLLGNQPWVLRLPAFLAGVLLVPATYALARQWYGTRTALLASTLVAVSSYLVEYSTNARGYTLQALCFVTMFALVAYAIRQDSPRALLPAVLVGAFGAYALPTMLYGLALVATWSVLEYRRFRSTWIRPAHLVASALALGLVVVLLYLPVMLVSGPDKLVGNRFVVSLEPADLLRELPPSLARTWGFWNRDVPLLIAAALLVGFVVALVLELRARRLPLAVLAPAVCLVLVLVQRVAPFERVWLFLLPVYFTIAAAGITRWIDGRLAAGVAASSLAFVTLTSGSILTSRETGTFVDAEAVAQRLRGRLDASHDAVITTIPASLPELQYYFPRAGLPIETLVREPNAASRLWAVAPQATTDPGLEGWRATAEPTRLPNSTLFQLERL